MHIFYLMGVVWGFVVTPWRAFQNGVESQRLGALERALQRVRRREVRDAMRKRMPGEVRNADRAAPDDEGLPF